MKRIQCIKDFNEIKDKFPNDFIEYLKCEFYSLFEYLSNGEGIEDFLLETHQAIILVEELKELDLLLRNGLENEFIEEIQLEFSTCMRIGIFQLEDIQLHYFLKG